MYMYGNKITFSNSSAVDYFLYFKVHQPKEESLSPSQKSPKLDTKFSSPSPHSTSTVKVSGEMQSPNQRYGVVTRRRGKNVTFEKL